MLTIDIATIDRSRFHVNEREIEGLGQLLLIVPHKAMWDWDDGEEHLRSLLCRPDGTIVSCGFPKFYNFGERAASDAIVQEGLPRGEVHFTEKVDGSLIIRSVIDGKVHFRTRGCELIASDMRDDVMRLIADRYPLLLDPGIGLACSSLLMEYVGPRNQIVVKYDEPKLYALGWSDWSNSHLRVFRYDHDAWQLGLERLRTIDVPAEIGAMRAAVGAFDGVEGIVTWTRNRGRDGSFSLCKFKSGWYLRLHSLRSQATPRYIREYCYLNGITSLDDGPNSLKASLLKHGFDWEVVSYIEPMFNEFMAHRDQVTTVILAAETLVTTRGLRDLTSRKDIAMAAKQAAQDMGKPEMFHYILRSALKELDEAKEIWDAMLLDAGIQQLRLLKKQGVPDLEAKEIELD